MRAILPTALLCLPLALACGDKDGGDDTGPTADGGTSADGGTAADGGTDGGTAGDGGTTGDGGTAGDGGTTGDGGTAGDGGTDGGTTGDGGATSTGWEFGYGRKGVAFTTGDVAVTADGDVWLGAKVEGTLDLGGGELTTRDADLLLARVSADGAWQGGTTWGTAEGEYAFDLAAHPDGGIVAAGLYGSDIRLDPDSTDQAAVPDGGYGTWLSRFDGSLGHQWSVALAGTYRVEPYGVAATTGGLAVMGGWIIADSVDFDPGEGETTWTTTGYDAWLAAYDSSGAFAWLNVLEASDGGQAVVLDVAAAPDGGVVACGYFSVGIDVDDSEEVDLREAGAGNSAFLVKVDADGGIAWVQTFGDAPNTLPRAVAVNSSGEIAVAGGYDAETDLAPGAGVEETDHQDGYEVFLAVYDSDGNLDRYVDLVGEGYDEAFDVAIDSEGSVYALGVYTTALDTDLDAEDPDLSTEKGTGGFIVAFDSTTRMMWIDDHPGASRLAVDTDDQLYVTFVLDDAVDLLLGEDVAVFTPIGISDLAVVKVDPYAL